MRCQLAILGGIVALGPNTRHMAGLASGYRILFVEGQWRLPRPRGLLPFVINRKCAGATCTHLTPAESPLCGKPHKIQECDRSRASPPACAGQYHQESHPPMAGPRVVFHLA